MPLFEPGRFSLFGGFKVAGLGFGLSLLLFLGLLAAEFLELALGSEFLGLNRKLLKSLSAVVYGGRRPAGGAGGLSFCTRAASAVPQFTIAGPYRAAVACARFPQQTRAAWPSAFRG